MGVLFGLHAVLNESAVSMVVASIGSSAVLLYCAPAAPFSQPRNVVGGHMFSCAVGLALRHVPYISESHLVLGPAALAGAVALMQATNTTHPPAGATALLATTTPLDLFFLIPVYTASVTAVATAVVVNNIIPGRRYPQFW